MRKHNQPNNPMDPMTGDLERIRLALLEVYEREEKVDIAEWARRFPAHRDELLDYWIWLRGTTRLSGIRDAPEPPRDTVAARALQQATEAVALGKAWLDDAVEDPEAQLGEELKALRERAYEFRGKAKKPFRKAAVYTWVALSLAKHRPRVSRLATQKAAYFVERGLELGIFTDYRRKPLGPYDHSAKYRDAEPIAVRKGWLQIRGASIEAGPQSHDVEGYANRYLRSPALALRLVDSLARLSETELETWATVDWAAQQLSFSGGRVDVRTIRDLLGRSPEWKEKLRKPNFSETRIREALAGLVRLRFVEFQSE